MPCPRHRDSKKRKRPIDKDIVFMELESIIFVGFMADILHSDGSTKISCHSSKYTWKAPLENRLWS